MSALLSTNEFDPHGYPLAGSAEREPVALRSRSASSASARATIRFLISATSALGRPFGTMASEIDASAAVSPQVIEDFIPGLSLESAVTSLKCSDLVAKSRYSGLPVVM